MYCKVQQRTVTRDRFFTGQKRSTSDKRKHAHEISVALHFQDD